MKGSSYRERLRLWAGDADPAHHPRADANRIGRLARRHSPRRGRLGGGLNYPKADHLKQFVVLTIERQAWPFGRETEEVRALWQAAHQKVLLDEDWLGGLLSRVESPPANRLGEETIVLAVYCPV